MRRLVIFFWAALVFAQKPASETAAPRLTEKLTEQEELSKALGEAGNSGTDLTRALEHHLQKYPGSPQRAAIEKALAQWAIEANDRPRTILYGERVLQAEPANELQLIDHVTRALVETGDRESAKRALVYARRYETQVEGMRSRAAEGHMSPGQWGEQVDKNLSRARILEARALEILGQHEDALKAALSAWISSPAPEAARELAHCYQSLNRPEEAIQAYANSFALDDLSATEAERASDRKLAGALFRTLHGSETGLGDLFLQAYDRTRALRAERVALIKKSDPNFDAVEISDYTLPRADGGASLSIASLKGKTVVLDFWATWCGPCRAQHPLIENVKKQFKGGDVVFLSIDSDDDHSLVAPFLRESQWETVVYFDGGLERALKVASIPTTIVLDREGHVSSRMTGFIPDLFENMLKQRIEETRSNETHNNESRGN